MLVTGTALRQTIPVFKVSSPENSYLARVWGATYSDNAYLYPAYFPFAQWVFSDLRKLIINATWDEASKAHLREAKEAQTQWDEAESAWQAKSIPKLPVSDDFFPSDFTPYAHQRLGILRFVHWWRSFLFWDMGTGKTRTAVDAFRILRTLGKFKKGLVVAPPIVLEGWRREITRCSKGQWTSVIWDGSLEAEKKAKTADVVLVSYAHVRLEREAAHAATKELSVSDAQRLRYKLPLLTLEQRQKLERAATHPLYQLDFDVITADESHYLGNWSSGQTQAVVELSAKATRRYCLTGSPGDDPRKLYAQLYFLSPALMPMSYQQFEQKHLVISSRNKHVVVGFRFLNELNDRVNSVASRMKKIECLDLPPVTTVDLHYDLGVAQRARYNELVLEMSMSVAPELLYATPSKVTEEFAETRKSIRLPHGATRVNKMLQVLSGFLIQGADYSICDACPNMEACVAAKIRPYTKKCEVIQAIPDRRVLRDIENPKLDLCREQLQLILEEDVTNKIIIWANYSEELEDIEKTAKDLNVGYVRVDGKTLIRQKKIDQFQNDNQCRIYIGQVSTGIGVTLTAANYTIFYSLPWDPLQYRQAMDRNNRPGQTRPMMVYRLLSSDQSWALDRYVAQVLTFKENIALTITELVACGGCDRQMFCAEHEILPFRAACKYAANVAKPVAEVEVIEV